MKILPSSLLLLAILTLTSIMITSCGNDERESEQAEPQVNDPHSYAEPWRVKTDSLHLELMVDFDNKLIRGRAVHFISEVTQQDTFTLDTEALDIESVEVDGELVEFSRGKNDPILGTPLYIPVKNGSREVSIQYSTTKGSKALLWVPPHQTAGGEHPFLFTQGQAILTRSWIPCQDSPGIRFPYSADVTVPSGLMAIMSATNPQVKNENGQYSFTMELPIPAYLIALAAGDLVFGAVGPRTGVYAEPSVLDAAVYEFGEMEDMLEAAEELYGEYRWGRYDLVVLPPSFPFGGMENPRLTFATPTILAGDRSLTALVAHELAHSWSGNLVTNETWDDFWLNEGFTVYFERRIMEAIAGKSYEEMLASLSYQDLAFELDDLAATPEDTHLKLDLEGRDPDEGMTSIAYDKGALMLYALEQHLGRDTLDKFLSTYFDKFAFQTMSTERFVTYARQELGPALEGFDLDAWIYQPGLPEGHPVFQSSRFAAVDSLLEKLQTHGTLSDTSLTSDWSTHEWLHFLRNLPPDLDSQKYSELDERFNLTQSENSEIIAIWLEKNIRNGRTSIVKDRLTTFLNDVGRRKFLTPLYRALIEHGELELAREIFAEAGPKYHSISYNTIEELVMKNN